MVKGELQKRMKLAEQKVPVKVSYTTGEKMETAIFFNTLKIQRMIEEAKKEFLSFYNSDIATFPYLQEVRNWFVKWFGLDADK